MGITWQSDGDQWRRWRILESQYDAELFDRSVSIVEHCFFLNPYLNKTGITRAVRSILALLSVSSIEIIALLKRVSIYQPPRTRAFRGRPKDSTASSDNGLNRMNVLE